MENLYYLVDEGGLYRNFVIFCREDCELSATKKREDAIVYTPSQMDIAKRYFKRRGIVVTPQIKTDEKASSKRRLRKGSTEGPDVSVGTTETDGA